MLLKGDCLELLKTLPDNSVDSIVTDPPYGLEFMGKEWDAPWKNTGTVLNDPSVVGGFQDGAGGNAFSRSRIRYGFGNEASLGFQYWFTDIAIECYRVLKPGGHILAFGGTRTYHRLAVAIEDAGFEIRDSIHWTYGSGFPKSHNVSKAFDRLAGAKREVVGSRPLTGNGKTMRSGFHQPDGTGAGETEKQDVFEFTAPATAEAKQWEGWGTALKPSHEPIVVARKPLSERTVANNVLKWGTGALNIDESRAGSEVVVTTNGKGFNGSFEGGTNNNGGNQHEGRWPANTILTHSSDCTQIGTSSEIVGGEVKASSGFVNGYEGDGFVGSKMTSPVWQCVESCPTRMFPETAGGAAPKKSNTPSGKFYEGGWNPLQSEKRVDFPAGSAARFFVQTTWDDEADFSPIIYQAKANKKERNAGLEGLEMKIPEGRDAGQDTRHSPRKVNPIARQNFHPTVKPVSLMRYLVKLVTPPGGVVLDPFLGSGTTAVAAVLEGFEWIGCELTPDYHPIIEARVLWAEEKAKGEAPKLL